MTAVPGAAASADLRGRPVDLSDRLPVRSEDLGVAWMTSALGLEETGPHVLRSVAVERVGSDRGHLGSSYRVALELDRASDATPRSVVVKLPADGAEARETARRGRLYEREHLFFTELAHRTDVRAPVCLAAGHDADTDEFVLVLEDVSAQTAVDQVEGCPVALADATVRELARLHASWWGRHELYEIDWLTTFVHPARLANLSRLMRDGWPVLCATLADQLPPDALAVGRAVLGYLPAGLAALDHHPQTLLHGDPRLDNLMFDAGEQRCPIVLLDWQNTSRGPGASDLAYFLAQSLRPEDLREHGDDLVAGYHAELVGHGVDELALDDLHASLRQALPVSFAVAASLAVLADTGEERIGQLALGMAERALSAAEHMGLLEELHVR
jgi:aminoglycoside/choline kinase family phosphotransferase